MIGEAFGLFSLVGDVAAIVGPLILGLVTFLFVFLQARPGGARVPRGHSRPGGPAVRRVDAPPPDLGRRGAV
jgi:hypothetical protein